MEHTRQYIREKFPSLLFSEFPSDSMGFLRNAVEKIQEEDEAFGIQFEVMVNNIDNVDETCKGMMVATLLLLFHNIPSEESLSLIDIVRKIHE